MAKRYVYRLTEEELAELLVESPMPLEIISKDSGIVEFATYEPLSQLAPLREEEVDESWDKWKLGFGPVEAEDFVILPPWKRVILINPGRAFGTGLHPTTKLSLKMLNLYMREGYSVLDVGTGSGILAIASKMLGAERVLAIDISEEAVEECVKNSKLNGVNIECLKASAGDIKESFDLVVANLEIDIFRKELDNILPLFHRTGIFSGIYRRDELEKFLTLIRNRGLHEDKIFELEDWFGVSVLK